MSRTPSRGASAHQRWSVANRVLAASLGGYLLASLLGAVLALALPRLDPLSRAEGVLLAMLSSFAVHTLIVVWVFSTRSALRAWLGLAAWIAVLGLLALVLR